MLASELKNTQVVKGLNTLSAYDVYARAVLQGVEGRLAVPICGDVSGAKILCAEFIEKIGFDVVDLGSLANGRWAEPNQLLFGKVCSREDLLKIVQQISYDNRQ